MNRNLACFALVLLSAGAQGCTEEVGSCDDPREGRDTVLVRNQIQYGGQAIINEACAGCHGSQVKGAARRGAPAGLDFDVYPVESETTMTTSSGETMLELEPPVLSGLRERQRRIFEQRDLIWTQVKEGLMPPDGVGALYRKLESVFDSKDDVVCTRAKRSYEGIFEKSSMDVLRNWLACDAPIVEATGPIDTMEGVAGKAGYQYKACGMSEPGEAIPFETVYDSVLASCAGCHPSQSAPDLTTVDKAYDALVSKASGCDGKQYVVPGDSEASYLLEKLQANPSCGSRMPIGAPLPSSSIAQVRAWIETGARRASDLPDGEAAQSGATP